MSYDPAAENLALLKRTVTGALDFTGRSSRTEVIFYWFATALIAAVLGFAGSTMFSAEISQFMDKTLGYLFMIPLFALYARRMHDQDRTGWWTLLLPAVLALNMLRAHLGASTPRFLIQLELPLILGYLVLLFWPGTTGPNRFDADPTTA